MNRSTRITTVEGDITTLEVDAIVNGAHAQQFAAP